MAADINDSSLTDMTFLRELNGGLGNQPRRPRRPTTSSFDPCARLDPADYERLKNTREKPPYSYAQVIAFAINNSANQRLTLNEIYLWVAETFPFYIDSLTNTWKNSIRHNLSLNKCFVKEAREQDDPGKGSYWTVHPENYVVERSGRSRTPSKTRAACRSPSPYQPEQMATHLSPMMAGMGISTSRPQLGRMATSPLETRGGGGQGQINHFFPSTGGEYFYPSGITAMDLASGTPQVNVRTDPSRLSVPTPLHHGRRVGSDPGNMFLPTIPSQSTPFATTSLGRNRHSIGNPEAYRTEQEDTTAFAFASAFHNSTGGARGSLGASSSFSLGSGSDLGMLSSSLPDSTFLSPEGDDFAASANLSPSQIPVVSVSSVDDNHTQTLVSLQPDGSRPWVDPETERMLDAVVAREEMNGALVTEVPVQTPQEIWNDLFVPGSNQVEGLLQRQDGGRDEFLFPEACQLRPGENVPATTTSQMLEAYGIAGQYGQAFERTALSAGDIHLAPLHPGTPTSLTSLSPSPQPPGQRLSPSPSISPSPQPRGP